LLRRHDSELFILVINDSHLSGSDPLVYPDVFIDGLDLLASPLRDKR
jgi:hypothetical protein